MRNRLNHQVQAGSMADIAFLLLIFFLIASIIKTDLGITVKLPPWDPNQMIMPIQEHNVFSVLVNADNQLLVRGKPARVEDLRERAKEFILNPQKREDLSEKPTKAIISLKNDRGTKYETYLSVYNELKAAYRELWDEEAKKTLGKPYSDDLPLDVRKKIRNKIPFVLSEAEPTEIKKR